MTTPLARTATFLRQPRHVISTLRLLVLAGLALLGVSVRPAHPFLFWFCTCLYGCTIFGYLWARNRDYDLRRVKWAVFLFDVGMVSWIIILRGVNPTAFLTAYFGLVLMAAIVEGLGNAITNAVLVSCVYAMLTLWGHPVEELASAPVLSQFAFFFVVSIFMGHLAAESRTRAADRDRAQAALAAQSGVLRESTEKLREARETLRARDRLATLGMLSAGIAHELKNPLAAIVGNLDPAEQIVAEILDSDVGRLYFAEDLEELRQIVADCQLSSRQLQGVARDLTSVARGCASEVVEIQSAEVLEGARRMLCKSAAAGVRIVTSDATSRVVLADRGRLLQVLLNLGGNALDALGADPEGVLSMRAEDGPEGQVVLVVEDNGPGMPESVRSRIFEPFFTTKSAGRGTGLGLHLVNEIVRALGGTVRCRTVPGEGTTFYVTLPAEKPRSELGAASHGREEDQAADRGRSRHDSPRVAAGTPQGAV